VALDASVLYVPRQDAQGAYLSDMATGTATSLPADFADLVPLSPDEPVVVTTGEWPVPAVDTGGNQRYLAKDGSWASTRTFVRASRFVDGHAWVSDGLTRYFVDTDLQPTGEEYTSIVAVFTQDGPRLTITGYKVMTGGSSTGLVATDLTLLADPAGETVECVETGPGTSACVASTSGGLARLVTLPDETSTELPDGFTTPLSDHMVTDASGSTVYSLTSEVTFDVPEGHRADVAWGDAYVVAVSDDGYVVLDATGEVTSITTIRAQVLVKGTVYYWVTSQDRSGYVDREGRWLFFEAPVGG
ncbi:MAG: hypothetical protein FWD11_04425, partial [Micrococcales bacterium]|nr:hypothetical protein [Micrococcales bacterium]